MLLIIEGKLMIFRQLFDQKSSTFSYLLADRKSKDAILIDPVLEQVNRDLALINELGLTLKYTIDTHCHADHVTGAWLIKQKVGSKIACAKAIEAKNTDIALAHSDTLCFGEEALEVRTTPGHTNGCITLVSHSHKLAFTGDALLIRGCGRSDFQQGNAAQLFDSITQQIFTLPDNYAIYPAHDYSGRCASSVAEEKQYNARIGGNANKQDFVGYMNNMLLEHPKFIDIALPANLTCGEVSYLPEQPTWAPVELTYSGVYEVSPLWVAENQTKVTLLDVREHDEIIEVSIDGVIVIPLGELSEKLNALPINKPIVILCRSGRRSALAVSILNDSDITQAASMRGGIIKWKDYGLPVIRHKQSQCDS